VNDTRKRCIFRKLWWDNYCGGAAALQLTPILGVSKKGYLTKTSRGQRSDLRDYNRTVSL